MHFSKDSWHYILATKYSSLPLCIKYEDLDEDSHIAHEWYEGNLCDYLKYVMSGFAMALGIAIVSGVVLIGLLMPVWWMVCWLATSTWLFDYNYQYFAASSFGVYTFLMYVIVDANNGWSVIGQKLAAPWRTTFKRSERKDNFFLAVFKTIRHKMCFRLTVS